MLRATRRCTFHDVVVVLSIPPSCQPVSVHFVRSTFVRNLFDSCVSLESVRQSVLVCGRWFSEIAVCESTLRQSACLPACLPAGCLAARRRCLLHAIAAAAVVVVGGGGGPFRSIRSDDRRCRCCFPIAVLVVRGGSLPKTPRNNGGWPHRADVVLLLSSCVAVYVDGFSCLDHMDQRLLGSRIRQLPSNQMSYTRSQSSSAVCFVARSTACLAGWLAG